MKILPWQMTVEEAQASLAQDPKAYWLAKVKRAYIEDEISVETYEAAVGRILRGARNEGEVYGIVLVAPPKPIDARTSARPPMGGAPLYPTP